ncbi:adenylyl-sulfate kinase [Microbacterium karelineae]|uniref:adenylyl-sulfate kinase n=1 Tax=Microbacterium karelineae TaxID=2654283 RepID=UPI001E524B6C|nr:adenylyl-sulfate kinase [Microbacterium karelineae]
MTDVHVTLTSAQLRRVELALAGASGGALELDIDQVDIAPGDTLVLHDAESTDIAEIPDAAVSQIPPRAADVAQLGTGTAPELPGSTIVSGSVAARRPLGHRDRTDLRVAAGFERVPRAVLVTGSAPAFDSPEWASRPGPVVVVDRGDPAALAGAITSVEAAGRRAIVLPHAGSTHADARAAEQLIADEIDVWETHIPASPGRVILLTGLSGSGKSTISKLLVQKLAEVDERTTTLLDGDEVRLILSAGLGFSLEDRMLNVRRIGWVGATIARHGGIAVCAPIAPFEAMRVEMRRRVEEVGRFLLVHVSTPLEVCEQRDRKGLYAKARAGEIGSFTGISDPYQIPEGADLTIDASVVEPDDAVDRILAKLAEIDAE